MIGRARIYTLAQKKFELNGRWACIPIGVARRVVRYAPTYRDDAGPRVRWRAPAAAAAVLATVAAAVFPMASAVAAPGDDDGDAAPAPAVRFVFPDFAVGRRIVPDLALQRLTAR